MEGEDDYDNNILLNWHGVRWFKKGLYHEVRILSKSRKTFKNSCFIQYLQS